MTESIIGSVDPDDVTRWNEWIYNMYKEQVTNEKEYNMFFKQIVTPPKGQKELSARQKKLQAEAYSQYVQQYGTETMKETLYKKEGGKNYGKDIQSTAKNTTPYRENFNPTRGDLRQYDKRRKGLDTKRKSAKTRGPRRRR